MLILLENRRSIDFETWSDAQQRCGNDNDSPDHDNIVSMPRPLVRTGAFADAESGAAVSLKLVAAL